MRAGVVGMGVFGAKRSPQRTRTSLVPQHVPNAHSQTSLRVVVKQ